MVTPTTQPAANNLEVEYRALRLWTEDSIGRYKVGLSRVLYPLFLHVYLRLIEVDSTDNGNLKYYPILLKQESSWMRSNPIM